MKKFNIRKVLVPTDFSEISAQAFPYAEEIAKQFGAEIHLVHVLEKDPPIPLIRTFDMTTESVIKKLEDDTRNLLNQFKSKFSNDVNVKEVLLKGNDFEEIVDYSNKNGIDLIVIATHGRTGLLHTLLGSVAEKVIRYSKVPVLVITATKEEN
ncbi:MAG: universal stress protein [Ignavibacteria bacterium]|jgi:nucleotide-binding universal stress UspA family protein|nr:universal stress protein [Ignavibacteria bacterium]MDH7526927.1 universal stress protein [Ignavibacteria bacterium]NPV11766.1 universal stress protein [Ignavibacteria bacterium]